MSTYKILSDTSPAIHICAAWPAAQLDVDLTSPFMFPLTRCSIKRKLQDITPMTHYPILPKNPKHSLPENKSGSTTKPLCASMQELHG